MDFVFDDIESWLILVWKQQWLKIQEELKI